MRLKEHYYSIKSTLAKYEINFFHIILIFFSIKTIKTICALLLKYLKEKNERNYLNLNLTSVEQHIHEKEIIMIIFHVDDDKKTAIEGYDVM